MFTPTNGMFKRFNSDIMYPKPKLESNNSHNDNNTELDDEFNVITAHY